MSEQNFKFIKKNGKFICESNNFKIEYSKPQIQGKDENSSILSVDDILYYYYYIKIFKSENKVINGKNIRKWKLLSEKFIGDFPGVLAFQNMLNLILDKNKQDCQKMELSSGEIEYSYTINNINTVQDAYELQKIFSFDGKVFFNLYIGTGIDVFADNNTIGIRLQYLDYHDILVLKKCIDEFIKYSMELQTQLNKLYNKKECASFLIKDNILYKYMIENNKIDNLKINNVFREKEETLDINEIVYTDRNEFHSINHKNVMIVEINKKGIKLSDNTFIKKNKILNICRNIETDDERLKYGINGIANNLLLVLSISDREEFKNENIDYLIDKWKNVIIERTKIKTPEHNLYMKVKENESDIFIKIIEKIKDKIK